MATTVDDDHEDPVAVLVAAAAAGDPDAWEGLVERYSSLVWSIARSYRLTAADAAEVNQAVWASLVAHLGQLREARRVGAWLAVVTRHECLRTIRRGGREQPLPPRHEDRMAGEQDSVDSSLLADERRAALYRAISRLPPKWRSLMRELMVDPRPSYAEVAAALDLPIGSIGPIRQRCLVRLRNSPELSAIAG